ncbi:hypothetical protein [Dactylosporangium sp. NPDC048998]|uniref:hypothetical protein n=1 Tax=Dactylosporangium sp. NPDC048998 TaxID=3363976 RepID=UPI00372014E4
MIKAVAAGPTGQQLADALREQIRIWDRDRTAQPTITVYLADVRRPAPRRATIDKTCIRMIVSYY